jgi:large subunit ribosomal protein L30e
MYEEEIRKLLGNEKMLIGRAAVMKKLRKGLVNRVFIANNYPKTALSELEKYKSIAGVEIFDAKVTNVDLGTICKKPFPISIIGMLK